VAFNLAFEEFDLPYRWDEDFYGELLRTTGGQPRLQRYLKDQGMATAERDRLVPELHTRKTEIMSDLVERGTVAVRPGVHRLLGELAMRGCALAVATTGSRGWVERLLGRLVPSTRFDVVVTGDEVSARKPDPEAYVLALDRLGTTVSHAVGVEDSAEGLEAATGAGLSTVVVVNRYTAGHDLRTADLVLDGFGEPGTPARVLADRAGTGCTGILDKETLSRVLVSDVG